MRLPADRDAIRDPANSHILPDAVASLRAQPCGCRRTPPPPAGLPAAHSSNSWLEQLPPFPFPSAAVDGSLDRLRCAVTLLPRRVTIRTDYTRPRTRLVTVTPLRCANRVRAGTPPPRVPTRRQTEFWGYRTMSVAVNRDRR